MPKRNDACPKPFRPPNPPGTRRPAISVVVPVRNEAGNIAPLVGEIAAALQSAFPERAFEIVYVNDGSSDGTEQELLAPDGAASLAASDQACAVLRPVGRGAHRRRRARAPDRRDHRRRRPERSGLHPEADRRAGGAARPRIGLVAGQRVGRKATGFKKLQSRIANAVRGAVLKDGTRDTGCGLKAFRRDVFLALPYFDGAAPLPAGAGAPRRL